MDLGPQYFNFIVLCYSCKYSHFRYLHYSFHYNFYDLRKVLLPQKFKFLSEASVIVLSPHNWRDFYSRSVSYYAVLKGWLLPSLPPDGLRANITFTTETILWTLAYSLGCFPFEYVSLHTYSVCPK